MTTKIKFEDYAFQVAPASADDGGGFFVTFPDLPGCLADGESYEEAIANARDAFDAWMVANSEAGEAVPVPGQGHQPVKFVQRLPVYLHKKLTRAAELDGVSMNTLVTLFVGEGLARREERRELPAPHSDITWPTAMTFHVNDFTSPGFDVGGPQAYALLLPGADMSSRRSLASMITQTSSGGALPIVPLDPNKAKRVQQ